MGNFFQIKILFSNRRLWKRAAISVVLGLVALCLMDSFSVSVRIWMHREPFETVPIHRYYAIAEKNNTVEYMDGDSGQQVCVHALFPHFDDPPCWYTLQHRDQRIDE